MSDFLGAVAFGAEDAHDGFGAAQRTKRRGSVRGGRRQPIGEIFGVGLKERPGQQKLRMNIAPGIIDRLAGIAAPKILENLLRDYRIPPGQFSGGSGKRLRRDLADHRQKPGKVRPKESEVQFLAPRQLGWNRGTISPSAGRFPNRGFAETQRPVRRSASPSTAKGYAEPSSFAREMRRSHGGGIT